MTKQPLIIISGATAVGKTEISVELAKAVGGSIISADSMQVYKGFDIGTAKIRPEETEGIKHYLIDILEPDRDFSVYDFKAKAVEAINEIRSEGRIPIIVGGTGFYIQAVLYDIDFSEEGSDKEYRTMLEAEAKEKGAEFLHSKLRLVDPDSADAIHFNNIKRVIRALEFYHENGYAISKHNEAQRLRESPYNFAYFVLNRDRSVIYDRINLRVGKMLEDGLESEVRNLLASGISKETPAMNGLGYKEMNAFIDGSVTLDEAAETIRLNTRHFAKRQLTWFRREKEVMWLNYEDFPGKEEMLAGMIKVLKEKKIV